MTDQFLKRLLEWIAANDVHRFYDTTEWRRLTRKVSAKDNNECQLCKARGRYRRADLVHHINHVKDRPDLALSEYYKDADGKRQRNLISVCKECHETVCHPDRMKRPAKNYQYFPERWD